MVKSGPSLSKAKIHVVKPPKPLVVKNAEGTYQVNRRAAVYPKVAGVQIQIRRAADRAASGTLGLTQVGRENNCYTAAHGLETEQPVGQPIVSRAGCVANNIYLGVTLEEAPAYQGTYVDVMKCAAHQNAKLWGSAFLLDDASVVEIKSYVPWCAVGADVSILGAVSGESNGKVVCAYMHKPGTPRGPGGKSVIALATYKSAAGDSGSPVILHDKRTKKMSFVGIHSGVVEIRNTPTIEDGTYAKFVPLGAFEKFLHS